MCGGEWECLCVRENSLCLRDVRSCLQFAVSVCLCVCSRGPAVLRPWALGSCTGPVRSLWTTHRPTARPLRLSALEKLANLHEEVLVTFVNYQFRTLTCSCDGAVGLVD